MTKTHIICFGNLWQGDDGFGTHVFRALNRAPLPEQVRVFDAGISGLSALICFEGCEKAIIVDALSWRGKVGCVHRLRLGDALPPGKTHSTHQMGLNYLLEALPIALAAQRLPDIVIYGAEIEQPQAFIDRLSPLVQSAVAVVEGLIRKEVCAV